MNRYRFFTPIDLDKISEYKLKEKEKYKKRLIPFNELQILDKETKNVIAFLKKEDFKTHEDYFNSFVKIKNKSGWDKIEIICDNLKVEKFTESRDPLGYEIVFEFETSLIKFNKKAEVYCQKSGHKEIGDSIMLQDKNDNKVYNLNGDKSFDQANDSYPLFGPIPKKLFIWED